LTLYGCSLLLFLLLLPKDRSSHIDLANLLSDGQRCRKYAARSRCVQDAV